MPTPARSYLTEPDFVSAVAPESDFSKISRQQYGILFKVADRKHTGRVDWDDFVAFEELLKKPAAEYDVRPLLPPSPRPSAPAFPADPLARHALQIAFRVFDTNGDGQVLFNEFKSTFQSMRGPDAIPFDFDSPWVKLYLGKQDGGHVLGFKCVPLSLARLPRCSAQGDQADARPSRAQRVHPAHQGPPGRAPAPGVPPLRHEPGRLHRQGRVQAHHLRARAPQAVGRRPRQARLGQRGRARRQDQLLRVHRLLQRASLGSLRLVLARDAEPDPRRRRARR